MDDSARVTGSHSSSRSGPTSARRVSSVSASTRSSTTAAIAASSNAAAAATRSAARRDGHRHLGHGPGAAEAGTGEAPCSTISRAAAVASSEQRIRPATIAASVAASRADSRVSSGGATTTTPRFTRLACSSRAATRARAASAPGSVRRWLTSCRHDTGRRAAVLRSRGGEALVEDRRAPVDLVGGRDQRRDDPDDVDVGPGGQDDQVALRAPRPGSAWSGRGRDVRPSPTPGLTSSIATIRPSPRTSPIAG